MERGTFPTRPVAVSLGVSALALLIFAVLAYGVVNQTMLVGWDHAVDNGLRQSAVTTPTGEAVFTDVSRAGSTLAMAVLSLAMAIAVFLTSYRRLALVVLVAGLGGCYWDRGLKQVFHLRRPPLVATTGQKDGAKPAQARPATAGPMKISWGFPSGHSLGSIVGYGLLAYLLILLALRRAWARVAIIILAAVVVLLIGFSRLYLHAHYLSQVLAGFAFGAFWLSLAIMVMELLRRRSATVEAGTSTKSTACLTEV